MTDYCNKCGKETDSVKLFSKIKLFQRRKCLICNSVTCSAPAENVFFKEGDWK